MSREAQWTRGMGPALVLVLTTAAMACTIDRAGRGPVADAGTRADVPLADDARSIPDGSGCMPPGCEDGIPCTLDTCMGGTICDHLADDSFCTDAPGGRCDPLMGCQYAQCDPPCFDGDPCTEDVCRGTACVYLFNEAPCDDGDPCTELDLCSEGVCLGTASTCDDGNQCTVDTCAILIGCRNDVEPFVPCDDGDLCTHSDECDALGVCTGIPVDCFVPACACNPASGLCEMRSIPCA